MSAGQRSVEQARRQLVAAVPYAAYLGIRIEQGSDSRHYRLPFRPDLIGNSHIPALHGGTLAALLEMAMQFEVLISQAQQRVPYPVDFSIDYWRSARTQDTLAACRLIRQGRWVAQVQAECWQDGPQHPVALARAEFLLRDAEAGNNPGSRVPDR